MQSEIPEVKIQKIIGETRCTRLVDGGLFTFQFVRCSLCSQKQRTRVECSEQFNSDDNK